jgi:beta-xylosidase
MKLNRITLTASALCCSLVGFSGSGSAHAAAHNPLIWADVPDISVMRVGKTYYMSSTTMHMSPGLPIMKSEDLVNWSMASYAYQTLADNEALRLENGQNAYSKGSWASSMRYHKGVFYASTFAYTTGRTHIYTTRDPERGPWKETSFEPALHDHSLFFDDDGRVYMVYGGGRITLVELEPDLSGIKPGGVNQVLIENVNTVFGTDLGGLNGEGSQLSKINGRYYLVNIASPGSRWARSVIVNRADAITGPYEARIVLDDRGIAQGGLIDTPEGKWYAYLFKDNDSVGRIPYLVPVTWKDGWPVLGENGKAPMTLDIPASGQGVSGVSGIVASDEFDRPPGAPALPLAWQWNHNPDNKLWSVTQRPGFLRLTTGRVDADLPSARNTLTQRTFGPDSSATTSIDVSGMKDGDYAGIAAFQKRYGFVGVKMSDGAKSLVMVSADSDKPEEVASVPLAGKTVHLKVECEFEPAPEVARFSYSLDGKSWTPIGRPSALKYTVPHFMGYRFALFYYSTKTAGGRVDFDYYRIGQSGLASTLSANAPATRASLPPLAPRTWTTTGPLVYPTADTNHPIVAVKDPSVVFHDGRWHIFATTAGSNGWGMAHFSFSDWDKAKEAKPFYFDENPNLAGYNCAPQAFYFRPQKKWYMIFQSQHPRFSTTADIADPMSWSAPQNFFEGTPKSVVEGWLDYWIICDDTHAYLFFPDDHGRMYRSRTRLADFPRGFDEPVVVLHEAKNDLFEGSCVYRVKGADQFLLLVECIGKHGPRYYRAFVANRLDGEWKPLPGANSEATPFAGDANVRTSDGSPRWAEGVSHGELLREGSDETMTVDPKNLRFLYQGLPVGSKEPDYLLLPYRLAILKPAETASASSKTERAPDPTAETSLSHP